MQNLFCNSRSHSLRFRDSSDRYISQLEQHIRAAPDHASVHHMDNEAHFEEALFEQRPAGDPQCEGGSIDTTAVPNRDSEGKPASPYRSIELMTVSPKQHHQPGGTRVHSWHQQQFLNRRDWMRGEALRHVSSGSVQEEVYIAM